MVKKLQEIFPGEILSEEFLKPMGISNSRLAADLNLPVSKINQIMDNRCPITADIAMRLSVFFKMEAKFRLNLQAECDSRIADAKLLPEIKNRIHPLDVQTA